MTFFCGHSSIKMADSVSAMTSLNVHVGNSRLNEKSKKYSDFEGLESIFHVLRVYSL